MSWTQGFASREQIDQSAVQVMEQFAREKFNDKTFNLTHCVYDTNYYDFVFKNILDKAVIYRYITNDGSQSYWRT
jgi:hypothetical protein